jgi:uncharacterized protein YjbI with pentapeptide repeats
MDEFFKQLSDPLASNLLATISIIISILFVAIPATGYYLKSRLLRENKKAVGNAFRETVEGLSASSLEVRMASAILLRRFFDKDSELGLGGTPFAKEAVHVIAAVLKSLQSNDFQKMLADGLRHAPVAYTKKGDFQRANLSKAYLGAEDAEPSMAVNMERADFFQANLSGASFRNAKLSGAHFYEALLSKTIFRRADLSDANFRLATLQDTDFRDANLKGAKFDDAVIRNVNFSNADLTGATFLNTTGVGIKGLDAALLSQFAANPKAPPFRIFISRSGSLDVRQRTLVQDVKDLVLSAGCTPVELPREDYDRSSVLSSLSDRLDGCSAMIVLGFKSIHVANGSYRDNTDDKRVLKDEFLSTPWLHIEAGMGLMKKIPVLLICDEGISDGIFDATINDTNLERLSVSDCLMCSKTNVRDWLISNCKISESSTRG